MTGDLSPLFAWHAEGSKRRLALPPLSDELVRHPFQFVKVSTAVVDELVSRLQGLKVLEIFSGAGMLAGYLQARGVDVIPTSLWSSYDGSCIGLYADVQEMHALEAMAIHGASADVLLMAWPEVTDSVLHACERWHAQHPGRDIIFIGEVTDHDAGQLGGCATDAFFEAMAWHDRLEHYQSPSEMEKALVGRFVGRELARQAIAPGGDGA